MDVFTTGIENLRAFVDLGGPVVLILIGLFIIALTTVVIKLYDLVVARLGRTHTLDRILAKIDAGEGLEDIDIRQPGLMPAIMRDALAAQAIQHTPDADLKGARDRVFIEAEHRLAHLDWGNRILEQIAQIAPLLGLFGTVLGMIDAFRALQSAGSIVDPAVLAGGIWVALMTTAAGLAVAMPVSIALSFFEAQSDKARGRAEHIIEIIFSPGLRIGGTSWR